MGGDRQLATWLLGRRGAIERAMASRLEAAPAPDSGEAEALRRFRSFLLVQLGGSCDAEPSLEGLRVSERRAGRLLGAWLAAAESCAGSAGPELRARLAPLAERFRLALRGSAHARRRSGVPLATRRRAVSAAIDRVADAYLAVDADTGVIADANPAAGALLCTTRDSLLGSDALSHVDETCRDGWWGTLDAVAEGGEPRRLQTRLRDAEGRAVPVEANVTRFATRQRTLALFLARPLAPSR